MNTFAIKDVIAWLKGESEPTVAGEAIGFNLAEVLVEASEIPTPEQELDEEFQITDYNIAQDRSECGTVACIAGFLLLRDMQWDFGKAERLVRPGGYMYINDGSVNPAYIEYGARILRIPVDKARRLFCPTSNQIDMRYRNVTSRHVVRVLEHLLATGEVDWSQAHNVGKA